MRKLSKLFIVILMFLVVSSALVACSENSTAVTSISISGSDTVTINVEEQYTTIIFPDNATNRAVTWEVISGTATIDEYGFLTATAVDTVTIRATADGKSSTKEITVSNPSELENPTDPLKAAFSGFETVNATTYKIKVSNATESLNIGDVATIESSWKLTTDMQATNEIPSKIATPLNIGDNTFYVLVSADNNVRLYTLQIRRRPIYEVTFNTNGGNEILPQYIEEDDFATIPNEPTKNGYKFDAWESNLNISITTNTVFIADWIPITYSVQFNKNSDLAIGTMSNQLFIYDVEQNLTLNTFSCEGYSFDGWTTYADGQSVKNLSTTHGEIIDLYANWKANNYSIVYRANNGTHDFQKQDVTFNESTTLESNALFSKTGYSITGWNSKADGSGTNYPCGYIINEYNIVGNLSLYAIWSPNTYLITFNANGGELNLDVQTVVYDSSFVLPTPTRDSFYRFEGWYDGQTKVENGIWTAAQNKTLTARWLGMFNLNGVTITGITAYGKTLMDIVILKQVEGVTITGIGINALAAHRELKSITIPDSISSIHKWGLDGSDCLTKIDVDENNANYASENGILYNKDKTELIKCPSLVDIEELTIPESVTVISRNAFRNCTKLTSITLPSSIHTISNGAFYGTTALTTINFNATNMKDLEYSNSVFYDSGKDGTGITVNIGASVTKIPANLFHPVLLSTSVLHKPKIITVKFMSGSICESIGANAFAGCAITNLNIPDSVTTINEFAFSGTSNITFIISSNLLTIGQAAFGHDLTVYTEFATWQDGWQIWYGSLEAIYWLGEWHIDETTGKPTPK